MRGRLPTRARWRSCLRGDSRGKKRRALIRMQVHIPFPVIPQERAQQASVGIYFPGARGSMARPAPTDVQVDPDTRGLWPLLRDDKGRVVRLLGRVSRFTHRPRATAHSSPHRNTRHAEHTQSR